MAKMEDVYTKEEIESGFYTLCNRCENLDVDKWGCYCMIFSNSYNQNECPDFVRYLPSRSAE